MSEVVFLKDTKLQEVTPVENIFISAFMPAAPELALKAYLYGLMQLNAPHMGDIETALGCDAGALKNAFEYWASLGLVEIIGDSPLQIRYLGVRSAFSVSPELRSGGKYAEFVKSLQSVLGTRVLTGAELSRVYDWLDVFGFEPEAALLIVKHCLDTKGAKTGVAYMDKLAKTLAAEGVFTKEGVEERFAEELVNKSGAAKILKRWNLRRPVTEDELALYSKWINEWGFDEAGIDAACVLAINAQKPSFGYLDSVLNDLHREGSVDPERIRELQRRDDAAAELAREAFKRAGLKSRPSLEQRLQILEWNAKKCIPAELILLAAELSADSSRPYADMKATLEDWYAHGVSSVAAARERHACAGAPKARNNKNRNRALNYMRGEGYSKSELEKLGISLGEEFYKEDE